MMVVLVCGVGGVSGGELKLQGTFAPSVNDADRRLG
jgi:hypothetical protein